MNRIEVRRLLTEAADPEYKEFNDKIANCQVIPSIGVRVPQMRALAQKLAKDGWQEYLEEMEALAPVWQQDGRMTDSELFQEEHMLQGMLIGYAKMDDAERVRHLDSWIPGIVSWADCDCCVSGFKFMKKNQDFWFDYSVSWLPEGKMGGKRKREDPAQEFCVRYVLVALMQHFINDTYMERVLEIIRVSDEEASPYYVKMAQAWALSVCFVKYREQTLQLFEAQSLTAWVQNKAIQKCRESYRVSPEDKELLKGLKM